MNRYAPFILGLCLVLVLGGLVYTVYKPPFKQPADYWTRSCEDIMADEPPTITYLGRQIRCMRDDIKSLKARLDAVERRP